MAADRMRRVNEALREVLSAHITADLKDPRIGFVTVTAVETAPDLSQARVYVSVLGTDEEREDSLVGLRSSRGYLQASIAAEVRMKRTPTLEFLHDEAIDRGFRISELLEEDQVKGGHRPPLQPDEVKGGHRPPLQPPKAEE